MPSPDLLKPLLAYLHQLHDVDQALEERIVAFFLVCRDELTHDVADGDVAGLLTAICRCLDLDLPLPLRR
jgi:hypothetical protein